MATQVRCSCQRCTIRGLMGPAIITTLGILFLLSELRHGSLSFVNTFPILFIVIGAILLASALAPMDGHITPPAYPAPPAAPTPPPAYTNPTPGQGR
jgi:hypothetical protein